MIDLPLTIPRPTHPHAKLTRDMVAQMGMVAANCVSGAGAAPESHTSAPEHIAIHSEGGITNAPQSLSVTRLGGVAGNALPVAHIPLGLVSLSAWYSRVETRKAALGGLTSA
jgi:hypothetical protein